MKVKIALCYIFKASLVTHLVTATLNVVSTVHFITLNRSAQVQYNYNTTAIQELFSCISAVFLHLCRSLQYNAAIQAFYNLQKTCRLLAAVVKLVLQTSYCTFVDCKLRQYNKIFVLCYLVVL